MATKTSQHTTRWTAGTLFAVALMVASAYLLPSALDALGVATTGTSATHSGSFDPAQALILSEVKSYTTWAGQAAHLLGTLLFVAPGLLALGAMFFRGGTPGKHYYVRVTAYVLAMAAMLPAVLAHDSAAAAELAEEQNSQEYVAAAEWLEERYDVEVNPADVAQILKTGESGLLVVDGHSVAQLTNVSDTWLLMQDQSLTEYPRT